MWSKEMPTWRSRQHVRGLLGWGETRRRASKNDPYVIVEKKGCIKELCRTVILKGIDKYFDLIGLPPVVAGESLSRAIDEGRFTDNRDTPTKRHRGSTRGQMVLVPLQPPKKPVDLLKVFLIVVGAYYCINLDPPSEDGLLSTSAVVGFLQEDHVRTKLLAQAKIRLHRMCNREFISTCVKGLNAWVREGDSKIRLKCIRELSETTAALESNDQEPFDDPAKLFNDMAFEVISCLLEIATGKHTKGYGFYPFGKPASESTKAFKQLPSSCFGLVLSEVYPFLVKDEGEWDTVLKKYSHPMTDLWPALTLKRHIHFGKRFRAQREKLFLAYEKGEGIYHGPEVVETPKGKTRSSEVVDNHVSVELDSSDDSIDGDFA